MDIKIKFLLLGSLSGFILSGFLFFMINRVDSKNKYDFGRANGELTAYNRVYDLISSNLGSVKFSTNLRPLIGWKSELIVIVETNGIQTLRAVY